ncbi:uncharacterized protein LOC135083691 [Ostrinia nubilalis]|uniref:uncharacterized protein LOC135083691 n=1 Tax=Ostrinia nubilalis TaxID=29057 RepID=UPI0030822C65
MAVATRFTTQRTTTRRRRRTAPKRWTFDENCDYTAYYCLRAFNTGSVCGKTIYYNHMTFKNYCMIEYVNCMERYDVWQVTHMGPCFPVKLFTDYLHYEYDNDDFLDRDYMVEDM